MLMVTEESTWQIRNIHANGQRRKHIATETYMCYCHRRKHTATGTYMLMDTEESIQHKHKCYWSQKKARNNRKIYVNGHRRKHTATETYMLSQKKTRSNRNIFINGHRRKNPAQKHKC